MLLAESPAYLRRGRTVVAGCTEAHRQARQRGIKTPTSTVVTRRRLSRVVEKFLRSCAQRRRGCVNYNLLLIRLLDYIPVSVSLPSRSIYCLTPES